MGGAGNSAFNIRVRGLIRETLSKEPKEAKPVKQESGREFQAERAEAQSRSASGVPRGQGGRSGVRDGEVGNEAENRGGGKGLQTSRKASTAATR